MAKVIYESKSRGLYGYNKFERFMAKAGAEPIRSTSFPTETYLVYQIWFLKGVVVNYSSFGDRISLRNRRNVKIVLHGNRSQSIGEVEKLIIEGAKTSKRR